MEMAPWRDALGADFKTHTVNLTGHGGRELPERFTMEVYVDDLLGQMDALGLQRPVVLGYSFGGVVALYLARHHPARVAAVVAVATQWIYDDEAVRHVTHLLQVPRLTALAHRREHLQRVQYPNDWRVLVQKLHAMFSAFRDAPPLTAEDLQQIDCPCLVLSGSSDPLAGPDEMVALHRNLRGSEIALYQGPAHPADRIPVGGLRRAVAAWASRRLPPHDESCSSASTA
jgi:pimeloyl-ACP methyl ester carboxylesterase